MNRPTAFDAPAIREALKVLFEPGLVFEVRVLESVDRTFSRDLCGFFDDADAVVEAVANVAHTAMGVYVTMNPLEPALLARMSNRLGPARKGRSAGDQHVQRRRWLLVDLDPERVAGVSSTEAELLAARSLADAIMDELGSGGWPAPVLACSGNGWHLLYAVDLPADDGGLVERVLGRLAANFDTEAVKVDPSVKNASRLTKLYGTQARKGDDTADRPHRMARIISAPAELRAVDRETLEAFARTDGEVPPPTSARAPGSAARANSGFDVEAWMDRHAVARAPGAPWPRGGPGALIWKLEICPWNPEHGDGSAHITQGADGRVGAGCHHNGCKGRNWHQLRASVEGGAPASPSEGLPGVVASVAPASPAPDSLPVFPEQAMIGLLADYVDLVAPTTEAPSSFLWGAAVAALSVRLGRQVGLPWGIRSMSPTLFVVLLGSTARTRKSTSISDAVEILLEPEVSNTLAIIEGSGSGEGFAAALADLPASKERPEAVTGRRALLVFNELGAVMEKVRRDQAGNLQEFLMAMFDAGRRWSSRTRSKDAPSFDITGGTLVVVAASTADWLSANLREVDIASGFVNRFLWIGGASTRSLPFRPDVPRDRRDALQRKTTTLLEKLRGDFVVDGEAREAHHSHYDAFRNGPIEDIMAHATARQDAISLRVAMLLAAAEGSMAIRARHIEAAWAVTAYSSTVVSPLITRVIGGQRRAAEDRLCAAARRASEVRGGCFTRRDVFQLLKGARGMVADDFNRIFRALCDAGTIVPQDGGMYRLAP